MRESGFHLYNRCHRGHRDQCSTRMNTDRHGSKGRQRIKRERIKSSRVKSFASLREKCYSVIVNRRWVVCVFAAAAAGIAGVCPIPAARAQVPSGPIAPLKKMEFKSVDPLGGAKLPATSPGVGSTYRPAGTLSQPAGVRSGGAAYYPDLNQSRGGRSGGSAYYPALNQPKGARIGGATYSAPGTTRQPIRATSGGGGSWRGR